MSNIPALVLDDNNHFLLDYVEEVCSVVFSMQADKSSGLDVFNPGFFQQFWDLIGPAVSNFCISHLAPASFPLSLNDTAISNPKESFTVEDD